ncbi:motility protein B [Sporosarcina newyorkensis 2681]|uniref:Motility protein B n=1 Tax=Sporosarcina newyorkensis 2681 TaxID=1027292 RepID=F9DUS3_9BACL|nr:motility protein B [Sporosarcina newyorkensis 2681]
MNELEKKNNRDQLYGLSNQLMELFVSDLFTKNKVSTEETKQRLTEVQKEKLKQTVEQLKTQVEEFLEEKNSQKIITETENATDLKSNPLREALLKKTTKKESENENNEDGQGQ